MDNSAFRPKLTIFLLACIVTFFSCKSQSSYWNDKESTFVIPSLQFSLYLPQNDNWVIADVNNLPPNILFCGVLPEEGIGLYMFSENDTKWNSVSDMTANEVEQQISPIYKQATFDKKDISYGPLETEKCKFLGYEAIKFQTYVELGEMCASFKGYMFFHRGHLIKYVLSEPCESDTGLGEDFNNFLIIQ